MDCGTGIGAKEFSINGHDTGRRWRSFEYFESNMLGKHANDDSGILSLNMHYEDI